MNEQFVQFLIMNSAWLIAAATSLALMLGVYRSKSGHLSRRIRELKIAKSALEAHYRAVQIVLDDPAPSKELKQSLCNFSDAVTDQDFGIFLTKMALDDSLFKARISAGTKKIHAERIDLEKRNEALKKAFHTASESGIVAIFLRWPETANLFIKVMAEIATDERNETRLTHKASSFYKGKTNDNNSNGPTAALPILV